MNPQPPRTYPDETPLPDVEAQAGDWLLRLSEDELPPDVVNAWLEWYHAEPLHRETFLRVQEDYERLKAIPREQKQVMAAAVLAETPRLAVPGESGRSVRSERRPWKVALAAAVVLGLSVTLWSAGGPSALDAKSGIYRTERGVHQDFVLADGSGLALGADSTASFRFTDEARYVVLERGEAFFEVAHDRSRPFIVNVGGMTVRAVGTAFNIRRAPDRVVVTVSEGIVDVQRGEDNGMVLHQGERALRDSVLRLHAGREVVMSSAATVPLTVKRADPEAAVAWRAGRLEFVDEPLSAVIATVNRYSKTEIIITSRELGRMTLTGSVMEGHIDEWLRSLPDIYPAQVFRVSEDTVLLSPVVARPEEAASTAAP